MSKLSEQLNDFLGHIAQIIHQGYHLDENGTWQVCPRQACKEIKHFIENNQALVLESDLEQAHARIAELSLDNQNLRDEITASLKGFTAKKQVHLSLAVMTYINREVEDKLESFDPSKLHDRVVILERNLGSTKLGQRIRAVLDEPDTIIKIGRAVFALTPEQAIGSEAERKPAPEPANPDVGEIWLTGSFVPSDYQPEREEKPEPAVPDVKGKWAVVVDDIKYLSPNFSHRGRIGDSFEIVKDIGTGWEVKVENETQWIQKDHCYPVLLDAPLFYLPEIDWTKSSLTIEEWEQWAGRGIGDGGCIISESRCRNCPIYYLLPPGNRQCWREKRLELIPVLLAAIAVEKARRANQTPINQPDPPESHDPADLLAWVRGRK